MKKKIKLSLSFAIICLVVGLTIIIVNYVLDNTNGHGISNNMSTLSEYRRSLTLMIVAIVMATISVIMMCASLYVYMRRKQAEDQALLDKLAAEEAGFSEGEAAQAQEDLE